MTARLSQSVIMDNYTAVGESLHNYDGGINMVNLFKPVTSEVKNENTERPARARARRLPGAYTLVIGIVIGALIFGSGIAIAGSAYMMAEPATSRVFVDGREVSVEAYQIEDANYFKLRDFAKAVDVGVWYDEDRDRVYIETDIGYDPKYTGVRKETAQVLVPFQKSQSVDVDNTKYYDIGTSATKNYTATVTIVELIRGEVAANIIKTASVHNPSAGIGREYVLAWVRAKITDSQGNNNVVLSDIRVNMNCYSSDGILYPMSNPTNINPINEQPKEVGSTVEGWIAFVVDRNDPEPRVQIGTLTDGEDQAVFALFD